MSAFIVPMDTPGVQMEKHLDKMGQRATDTSAFALTDVVVPAENRIGEEGEGFKIAMQTLDFTRPGTAAGAVGVAQAAYEYAVDYAKQRVTFDVPIAMHQGVNFMIADMATEIAAARLLVWQAAWLHDQGKRATLESSFAKRFSADTAMKVTTDAVQVFGGYGYMKEYPVEKLMRDAKLFQIYEGTSQIQRLVIAKEIFLPRRRAGRAHAAGVSRSVRQLPLERRQEAGREADVADPGAQALGLGVDRGAGVAADVLGQAERDLAVAALAPAADDASAPPDRRPGVAVRVEERRAVRAEVPPRSFQPIVVGSSVGNSAADGLGRRRRLEIVREHVAGRAAEVDHGVDPRERPGSRAPSSPSTSACRSRSQGRRRRASGSAARPGPLRRRRPRSARRASPRS